MWDGIYSKSQEPLIYWDNSFERRTEIWLGDWKEKADERELITVACGE